MLTIAVFTSKQIHFLLQHFQPPDHLQVTEFGGLFIEMLHEESSLVEY
ncbi:hypothetical protein B6N60_01705 [Richelia sinica FACHB-800]|uniref:Uncharacterized protein n=1 Tax=Richelia sinica FACHB-800 TaxID=1357546 RepID=A0A975T6G1_9NOST|nr:hypothetical protein [Richelia sinica]MBD2667455.1 hypothetical protein [Richelia sinica FACHB-800]QXE23017.1 hypothetical protein B6N60_01705 [Richelia sinica FACHB-800]